jgi:hypothetical protein
VAIGGEFARRNSQKAVAVAGSGSGIRGSEINLLQHATHAAVCNQRLDLSVLVWFPLT